MTTPSETPPPTAVPSDVISPAQPAGQDTELRDLVTQIMQSSALGFDPTTTRKAVVQSIETGTTPTLTVQMSGDTSVNVAGVRYLDSYSPVVGDTVLILKQGPDLVAIGRIAIAGATDVGWVSPSLGSGFSNAVTVQYRRVWDNGSWKMQWKGRANRSSGDTIVSGLATEYRPSSERRVAAGLTMGPATTLLFTTGGSVVMQNTEYQTYVSGNHDHGIGQNGAHNHGGAVPMSNTHGHNSVSGGDHSHGLSTFDAVSFDGVEYFL